LKDFFERKEKAKYAYYYDFRYKSKPKTQLEYDLRKEAKTYKGLDEKMRSHFFFLYLLKHRYSSFLIIEKFVIQLTYFFNPNYVNDLIKLTSVRSVIYFYHFIIIVSFIYFPIMIVLKFIAFILRKIRFF
jgi:hypothetical protein